MAAARGWDGGSVMAVESMSEKYPGLPSWAGIVDEFFAQVGFDPAKHGCVVMACPPGRHVVDGMQLAELEAARAGVRVPAVVKARARRGVDDALVAVPMGVFIGLVTGGEL